MGNCAEHHRLLVPGFHQRRLESADSHPGGQREYELHLGSYWRGDAGELGILDHNWAEEVHWT